MEGYASSASAPLHLRAGWLDKLPVSLSLSPAWKRRWIALYFDRVSWAKDPTSAPLGELPLGVGGGAGRIEVRQRRLVVYGSDGRKVVLRGSDEDLREWGAELEKCMGQAPSLKLASTADGASPRRSAMQVELSALDERLIQTLLAGHIRLLRVAWLLAQPVGYRIQRRQELEALEESGAEQPLLRPEEAAALVRRGDRSAGALTYGWLCPGEPDPAGSRVTLVRTALEENTHIEGLFWECVCRPRPHAHAPDARPAAHGRHAACTARHLPPMAHTLAIAAPLLRSQLPVALPAPAGRQTKRASRGELQVCSRHHGRRVR